MNITTVLGGALAELSRSAIHLAASPGPRELLAGVTSSRPSTALALLAVLAWGCAVLTLVAASSREGRGGAGARSGADRRAPGERSAVTLPPRRRLASALASVQVAEVVPVGSPRWDAAPGPRAAAPRPAAVRAVAPRRPAAVGPPISAPSAAELPLAEQAAPLEPAAAHRPTPVVPAPLDPAPLGLAPLVPAAAQPGLTAPTATRCRRCTQPRCWPSTGERSPARTIGVSAPRGCRAPVAARAGLRCQPADEHRRRACGARGPFRELTALGHGGPPRGRGPRRRAATPG